MDSFLICIIFVFLYMNVAFFLSCYKKDFSIADLAWGLGFAAIALIAWIVNSEFTFAKLILFSLIFLWAIRLSGYIYLRHREEDWRYQNLRKWWEPHPNFHAYFKVFMLQGLMMALIASPVIWMMSSIFYINGVALLGFFVTITGIVYESVADYQMQQFRRQKKDKNSICKFGLWRYSRHPNYFGEILVWWGVFIAALTSPYGWIFIFSPCLITYLLVRVSGAPMLESKYKENQEYQEYIQATNSIVPWMKKG